MSYNRNRTPFDYEPVTRSPRAKDLWEGETVTADDFRLPRGEDAAGEEIANRPSDFTLEEPSLPIHRGVKPESWIMRRGHAIAYAGLFLFTFVLYFRPYELFPALAGLSSMAFWIAVLTLAAYLPAQLSLEGNLTARPREVNLMLMLCLAAILSIPLAINPGEAFATFQDFLRPALMFIVLVNVVRTEGRLKGLFFLTLAVSCVLGLGAVNDYRQGNFAVEGYRVAGRIGNLFGNPNDMALHLLTVTPIAVGLMLGTRGVVRKALYAACVVLTVMGNIITFSRGAFLGLLGVCGVLAWKLGRRNRFLVTMFALVFVAAFVAFTPGNYTDRLGSIFDHSRDAVGSASARQDLLVRSIAVSIHHPLLGVGMGNFHTVSINELVNHNAYMQVATEMGWWALAIYSIFMITALRGLSRIEQQTFTTPRADRQSKRIYYLAIALQASLVGYMISSFFISVAYQWYVYYLVGYAVCLRRIHAQTSAINNGETSSRETKGQEAPGMAAV